MIHEIDFTWSPDGAAILVRDVGRTVESITLSAGLSDLLRGRLGINAMAGSLWLSASLVAELVEDREVRVRLLN